MKRLVVYLALLSLASSPVLAQEAGGTQPEVTGVWVYQDPHMRVVLELSPGGQATIAASGPYNAICQSAPYTVTPDSIVVNMGGQRTHNLKYEMPDASTLHITFPDGSQLRFARDPNAAPVGPITVTSPSGGFVATFITRGGSPGATEAGSAAGGHGAAIGSGPEPTPGAANKASDAATSVTETSGFAAGSVVQQMLMIPFARGTAAASSAPALGGKFVRKLQTPLVKPSEEEQPALIPFQSPAADDPEPAPGETRPKLKIVPSPKSQSE